MHTRKQTTLFFAMLSFGWLMHVALDCSLSGSETISWIPLVAQIGFCPRWVADPHIAAGLDAIILLAWLIHEETKYYIRDYF